MDEMKPWYLSRTIWASVVVVMAAIAGAFGYVVEDADAIMLTDAVLAVVAGVGGIVAIIGRLAARARIG